MMFALELVGIAAFAVSGAMVALEKQADIFGVILLAVVTALGGGVTRDLLLGNTPPVMFTSYPYVAVAVLSALVLFLDAYTRRDKYVAHRDKLDAVNNIFDAAGLAVFTVSGMNMAMNRGDYNAFLLITLGVVTGVGGGVLRDMMLGTMAKLLRKRIYAVASLLGAVLYYLLLRLGVGEIVSALSGMIFIFALRVFATVFKWNLPTVRTAKS